MSESVPIRVLVVDDEKPARKKLRRLLDDSPGIVAIHEAPSGPLALEVMEEAAPDVVFLDVQMPGMDGFQVVASMAPDALPHVVFVTAHDEFAVRAFEVEAVDYLLKPYDVGRFRRALEKARDRVRRARDGEETGAGVRRLLDRVRQEAEAGPVRRILADAPGGERVLLAVDEVSRLESERNYVRIHARGAVHRVRATLTELEGRLDPARFLRISRSAIVNADRIVALHTLEHGDFRITLDDGTSLRLSRRYRDRLDAFGI